MAVMFFLLAMSFTAYAAPAVAQKSTQQTNSATSVKSPAPVKYDPNAPPKGTITIPVSSKGFLTGTYFAPDRH